MKNVNQVLLLINEYLKDIRFFIDQFEKQYGRRDILRAWHNGDIPQSGYIANTIEYELHGVGCCIFYPDKEVDFDFGPDFRIDGFDLWRLKKYLTQRHDMSEKLSAQALEIAFNELVKKGVINKIYKNSNLFFFVAGMDNDIVNNGSV